MTDLDRVVYVADMLEPGRKHAPLEPIREAVGTCRWTSCSRWRTRPRSTTSSSVGKLIHPDTVAVWNSLVGV